jgi:hypothetical protein
MLTHTWLTRAATRKTPMMMSGKIESSFVLLSVIRYIQKKINRKISTGIVVKNTEKKIHNLHQSSEVDGQKAALEKKLICRWHNDH